MLEISGGINWVWYHTDTREEAEAWFRELTGSDPGPGGCTGRREDFGPLSFRGRSAASAGLQGGYLLAGRQP